MGGKTFTGWSEARQEGCIGLNFNKAGYFEERVEIFLESLLATVCAEWWFEFLQCGMHEEYV